ncbi:MAG: hypothetical protein HY553_22030, partial [Elusimicrobia bacterium]|nr:hypothetical protein [Elusimicrobiota bacterium]
MPRRAAAGVALLSFSVLLLELALTRLFSAILFYHFAFLAISIALLGLGAGGLFAQLGRATLASRPLPRLGGAAGAAGAVLVAAMLWVILRVPVTLQVTWGSFLRLSVIYLAAAAPFFLAGLVLSVAFARAGGTVHRLYAADLAGGAAACLAAIPLLDVLGAPNVVLLAGAGLALSAVAWSQEPGGRRLGLALAAASLGLIAANGTGAVFDVVYAKGRRAPPSEFKRWNALSRVEVVRWPDGARAAIIDGDAATGIMSADPRAFSGSALQRKMMVDVSALPNALRPRGEIAIIGPGGGAEVLRAVGAGSPRVVGIEINPLIATTVMRERYAEYSRGLYTLPQVDIHVADGRAFLRSSGRRFDVIQMTLVDTWAATSAGAFALSENNLYTVEAFREYLERLAPDGLLAVTRWEFERPREALRVVSVALEALRSGGAAEPSRHLAVVSQGPLSNSGVAVTVLVKRTPFTPADSAGVKGFLRAAGREIAALDWRPGPPPGAPVALHLPGGVERPAPGSEPFAALLTARDPESFARGYEFDVSPVTDDAPFFFFTLKLDQLADAA